MFVLCVDNSFTVFELNSLPGNFQCPSSPPVERELSSLSLGKYMFRSKKGFRYCCNAHLGRIQIKLFLWIFKFPFNSAEGQRGGGVSYYRTHMIHFYLRFCNPINKYINNFKNLKIIVAILGTFCPGAQTHISRCEFLGENKVKSKLVMESLCNLCVCPARHLEIFGKYKMSIYIQLRRLHAQI